MAWATVANYRYNYFGCILFDCKTLQHLVLPRGLLFVAGRQQKVMDMEMISVAAPAVKMPIFGAAFSICSV